MTASPQETFGSWVEFSDRRSALLPKPLADRRRSAVKVGMRCLKPFLFLAFLLVDFADPSLPGVFSLEARELFTESAGAVSRAGVGRAVRGHRPLRTVGSHESETTGSYQTRRVSHAPRPMRRTPERRYSSRSFEQSFTSPDAH
jgi:hypothetical protein